MVAKAKKHIEWLTIAVSITITTVTICYILRPDLLNPRIAFSSLGAFAPTANIFTTGFVLAALFVFADAVSTKNLYQKICRIVAALGYAGLGVFRIEHGEPIGNYHRLSGLIMMLAVVASMLGHLITEFSKLKNYRKWLYSSFMLLALTSITMSILSSSLVKVMSLQGLAQYMGLISLIGWAMLDARKSTT